MNQIEIKEFRKKHNLSQQQLADLAGVSVRTVKSWEYGERNISTSALKIIQDYTPQSGSAGSMSNAKVLKEDEDFIWLETLKIPEKAALGAASNFFAESYMNELEKGSVRVKKIIRVNIMKLKRLETV